MTLPPFPGQGTVDAGILTDDMVAEYKPDGEVSMAVSHRSSSTTTPVISPVNLTDYQSCLPQ
jgi:hypothetical protein